MDEFEQISYQITEELGIYAISRFEDFIAGCIIQIPQVEKGLNFIIGKIYLTAWDLKIQTI